MRLFAPATIEDVFEKPSMCVRIARAATERPLLAVKRFGQMAGTDCPVTASSPRRVQRARPVG